MGYLVLARKYRPRSFDSLVGQDHVVQALVNALTQGRLHHAYLFAGTRGVGKTTVSRILAKALNCTGADGGGGVTAHPCGACEACRDIDSGRFVDYVELDAASNRGVDEISQLLDQAVYKPVIGRFKVYMIDEVHMLSNTAFNAMLKTLEEPPEYLKFVLATTDPQKVPATVLSRCLQFNLRPMPPQTVQSHLARVLEAEGIASEPAALRLLARAARGSMRDALSLADQAIAYGAGALHEGPVRDMLGAVDRGHAVRLLDALASGDGPALVEAADALRALGLSANGTLDEMAELLQQIAIAQTVPEAVGDADRETVLRLAGRIAGDEIQLFYSLCLQGRSELPLAPDEHSGLLMVLLRMLAFRPAPAAVGAAASARTTGAAAAASPARAAPLLAPQAAKASVAAKPRETMPRLEAPRSEPSVGAPPPWLDLPVQPGEPQTAPEATDSHSRSDAADAALGMPQPSPSALAATALADRWATLVGELCAAGRVAALVRELALQSDCVEVVENAGGEAVWRLRVERESLRAPAHCEKLQKALAEHLQTPLRLIVEAGVAADSPALRAARERLRRQSEAERLIRDDPVVRSLMSQFKTARIVPGSIQPC